MLSYLEGPVFAEPSVPFLLLVNKKKKRLYQKILILFRVLRQKKRDFTSNSNKKWDMLDT